MEHRNKIIEIVYICTGGYCNYAKPFTESLKYFFPGYKKILRIISDKCDEYEGFITDDVIYTTVTKKPNLIFPCVPIHKMSWVNEIPKCNSDYVFYFDADTIFREMPYYNWGHLLGIMDEGNVLLSSHPCYRLKDDDIRDYWLHYFYNMNPTKDEQYASFIGDDEYLYIITSFFAAKKRVMIDFCNKITSLQLEDMTREKSYYIPRFIDENYVNMLLWRRMKGENVGFDFYVDEFNTLYDDPEVGFTGMFKGGVYDSEMSFMFQKNMKNFKFNQR